MTQVTTAQRLTPVLIGIGLTIMFLIMLAYLADQRRNAQSTAHSIDILEPLNGATVDSPLMLRFLTTAPLKLNPSGWGTERLHLHARVDGVEHMPAATDISSQGSAFVWRLPTVNKGPHTIRLGWANLAHRELSTGSAEVNVTIR